MRLMVYLPLYGAAECGHGYTG